MRVSAQSGEMAPQGEPLTVAEAARQLRSGALTATALLERSLERIRTLDGTIQACVIVMDAEAESAAREADARLGDARAAGATIVAKTNTHEFAYGTFTPPTRNPWDVAR